MKILSAVEATTCCARKVLTLCACVRDPAVLVLHARV